MLNVIKKFVRDRRNERSEKFTGRNERATSLPTSADSDDQPTSRVIRDTESKTTTTSSNRSESSSSYEKPHALPPHYVHEPPSVEDDEKIQGI
jgi:hypothetical protein